MLMVKCSDPASGEGGKLRSLVVGKRCRRRIIGISVHDTKWLSGSVSVRERHGEKRKSRRQRSQRGGIGAPQTPIAEGGTDDELGISGLGASINTEASADPSEFGPGTSITSGLGDSGRHMLQHGGSLRGQGIPEEASGDDSSTDEHKRGHGGSQAPTGVIPREREWEVALQLATAHEAPVLVCTAALEKNAYDASAAAAWLDTRTFQKSRTRSVRLGLFTGYVCGCP